MEANTYSPLALDAVRRFGAITVTRTADGHSVAVGSVTRTLSTWHAARCLVDMWTAGIAEIGLAEFEREMHGA